MSSTQPQIDPSQIQGLPPGATIAPLGTAAAASTPDPSTIQGLPSGATIAPLGTAARSAAFTPSDSAPDPGALAAVGKAALGVVSGIGGGAIGTAAGIENLANRGLSAVGAPQIPAIPPKYYEENTPSEKTGGYLEQMMEFAGGEGVLPDLEKYITKYPQSIKLLSSVLKSGAVGGAQGALQASKDNDGVVRGAVGGAAGGAIGAGLGEAASAGLKPLAEKVGFLTSSDQDAIRALQVSKRDGNHFADQWRQAAPVLKDLIDKDGQFDNVADAAGRVREAANDIWETDIKGAISRHKDQLVDATPIANQIRAAAKGLTKYHQSDIDAVEDFAKQFDGKEETVGDLENTLENFNSKLRSNKFYRMTGAEQSAARRVDPNVITLTGGADGIREALSQHLSNPNMASPEPDFQKLKNTYGAVSQVAAQLEGRVGVAGRQQPISMKQAVGFAAGLAHGGPAGIAMGIAPAILDKFYNSPEALLNRAVAKSGAPGIVRGAVQKYGPPAARFIGTGAKVGGEELGSGIANSGDGPIAENRPPDVPANWPRVQTSSGEIHFIHPSDLPTLISRDPGAVVS